MCMCMLEEPFPYCSLQPSISVSASVAPEKYKERLSCALHCFCLQRWWECGVGVCVRQFPWSVLHPRPSTHVPPSSRQLQSHGATFIPVIGPRSPGSSLTILTTDTPGKRPSNSQTSHYHNIHPIRLHTFTIKTDTFTDACIIIHKDQTSFDTLYSTLEKWHIIYLIIHAA